MVKRTKGGSYVLGELDGSLSKLRFVAFQLLPYQPRDIKAVPVTHFSEDLMGDLEDKTHDSGNTLDVIGEVEAWFLQNYKKKVHFFSIPQILVIP